jgi:hypothetical protein
MFNILTIINNIIKKTIKYLREIDIWEYIPYQRETIYDIYPPVLLSLCDFDDVDDVDCIYNSDNDQIFSYLSCKYGMTLEELKYEMNFGRVNV